MQPFAAETDQGFRCQRQCAAQQKGEKQREQVADTEKNTNQQGGKGQQFAFDGRQAKRSFRGNFRIGVAFSKMCVTMIRTNESATRTLVAELYEEVAHVE